MTDDAFLDALRSDWQGGQRDTGGLSQRYRRNRAWARRSAAAGALGIVVILACLLWLGWQALAAGDPLVAIAAFAFAVALPVAVLGVSIPLRQLNLSYDQTPIGLLRQSEARALAMRGLLFEARWCAAILAAATAALWLAVALEAASIASAAALSLAWGSTALAIWLWQADRDRRLARELAECRRLIAEFDSAG